MQKHSIFGLLILCLMIVGCERDYIWDPNNIDEGAAERPFNTLESGTKGALERIVKLGDLLFYGALCRLFKILSKTSR